MRTLSEEIRKAVGRRIDSARNEGQNVVNIVSGDIVRELHLKNRTPTVCQVLGSKKLQEEKGVLLEETKGPGSGQSTTMEYTYRLVDKAGSDKRRYSLLWALEGAGKETYASLGGGEAFLKKERAAWDLP